MNVSVSSAINRICDCGLLTKRASQSRPIETALMFRFIILGGGDECKRYTPENGNEDLGLFEHV